MNVINTNFPDKNICDPSAFQSFFSWLYVLFIIYLSIYHLSVCLPIYPYFVNNNCSSIWLRVAVLIWIAPEGDPNEGSGASS